MVVTASLLAALLAAPPPVFSRPPEPRAPQEAQPRTVSIEIGASTASRGGLLETSLPVGLEDAEAAEEGLVSDLEKRPWLQIVSEKGEVAVAITRGHRWQGSRTRSKDGKRVTLTFRYQVRGEVGIVGDRETLEAEVTVSHSYAESSSRMEPSAREDRDAFERAGRELGPKVRAWILPRLAALRPDGPDAGFRHKKMMKWLIRGDGLEVTEVGAGGPAERAGLQVGDRIRRIDGEDGTSEMDERVWLWRLGRAGTRVVLEFERGGQRRTVDVELVAPQKPAKPGKRGPSWISESDRRPE